MSNPVISEIFLDLDGVCAAFDKRFSELFDDSPEEDYATSNNKKRKLHQKRFHKFIEDEHFATLDLIHGTKEAIEFFEWVNDTHNIPVCFLTSSAREEFLDIIGTQKKRWLKSHNIKFHMMIVPGKRYKCYFAKKGRLLIDDTKQNIDQWIHHGGIGLHHQNWETSINSVKNML